MRHAIEVEEQVGDGLHSLAYWPSDLGWSTCVLETELEEQPRLTVAGLGDVTLGAFAELEQAKGIAVAGLIECAGVAVAVLFEDAEVARTTLQDASSVAVAQLLENGFIAVQALHESVQEEAGGDGFVFFWRGAVDADGNGAREVGVCHSRIGNCADGQGGDDCDCEGLEGDEGLHECVTFFAVFAQTQPFFGKRVRRSCLFVTRKFFAGVRNAGIS